MRLPGQDGYPDDVGIADVVDAGVDLGTVGLDLGDATR